MAPVNMPSQSVQLRQQVILGSAPLPQIHKQGKRYGRKPVRTVGGDKLLAGRRHRAASGNDIFEENIKDMMNAVHDVDDVYDEQWEEEEEEQPTVIATPTLKPKEPKLMPESNPEPDFPALNAENLESLNTRIKERSVSDMSAGSFTEALQRKSPEIGSRTPKSPKKSSLKNIEEEEWMMVGQKGKVVPESLVGKAAVSPPLRRSMPEAEIEADPYDALEVKDCRRKPYNDWRPMGDAHTGRRSWKVDPSERERAIEAAQLKKQMKKQGPQKEDVAEDEDAGTEQKKRTRLDRKKDNRIAKAEEDAEDAASTTTDDSVDSEQSPSNGKKHTKKLRKRERLLSK